MQFECNLESYELHVAISWPQPLQFMYSQIGACIENGKMIISSFLDVDRGGEGKLYMYSVFV